MKLENMKFFEVSVSKKEVSGLIPKLDLGLVPNIETWFRSHTSLKWILLRVFSCKLLIHFFTTVRTVHHLGTLGGILFSTT